MAKYYDVASPSEELEYILCTARGYLARHLASTPVPWEACSLSFTKTQLRINEMLRVLTLNDDGSAAKLTWAACAMALIPGTCSTSSAVPSSTRRASQRSSAS